MIILSILVIIVLLTLPTLALDYYFIFRLITKGTKSLEMPVKPFISLLKIRSRHKLIYYCLLYSYSLVVLAVICWAAIEFASSGLLIASVLVVVLVMAVYFTWLTKRTEKIMQKSSPPPVDASDKDILDWQNKFADENTYNQWSSGKLWRFFGILVAFIFFVGIVIILVVLLLNK